MWYRPLHWVTTCQFALKSPRFNKESHITLEIAQSPKKAVFTDESGLCGTEEDGKE